MDNLLADKKTRPMIVVMPKRQHAPAGEYAAVHARHHANSRNSWPAMEAAQDRFRKRGC